MKSKLIGKKVMIKDEKSKMNFEGKVKERIDQKQYLVKVTDHAYIEGIENGDAKTISVYSIVSFLTIVSFVLFFIF